MNGRFFTGSTADGSDMKEVRGAFISPDGKEWSNMPYTADDRLREYLWDNEMSLEDEYELILLKKSKLSRAQRESIIRFYKTQNDD